MVKKSLVFTFILLVALFLNLSVEAQCAMCTKTASQLGEKPALGLNRGILYLMLSPFLIVGIIGYRWWKGQQAEEKTW
jgi:hypothetical protein